MNTRAAREAEIRQAYDELLNREPAPQALAMWAAGPLSLEAIRERIRGTEEFAALAAAAAIRATDGHARRILVFGAYGNGNLGDMIQADSLRRAVGRVLPSVGVWAASVMDRPYPFPPERRLSAGFVRTPAAVAAFDALLIGGGGLLAHPHDPLANAGWVRALRTPILIFGVGASDFFAPKAAELIRKAVHVSARDRESLLSLLAFRPDVHFGIDPVLGDRCLHLRPADPGPGVCWIVRGPPGPIHDAIRAHLAQADVVVGFEPGVDEPLRDHFPGMLLVADADGLAAALGGCARVISMRYHGVILGLKAGLPSYALDVPKGAALLRMLGLPGCAAADPATLLAAPAIDMERTAAMLDWLEELHELALGSALRGALGLA